MKRMLQSYKEKGYLKDGAYLKSSFAPDSYSQVHRNAMRRLQSAEMLKGEGIIQNRKLQKK